MAYEDLREMSDEQLGITLTETQKQLFTLRIQAQTEKLDAPSELQRLRRHIARIKTFQRQREIAATTSASPAATA